MSTKSQCVTTEYKETAMKIRNVFRVTLDMIAYRKPTGGIHREVRWQENRHHQVTKSCKVIRANVDFGQALLECLEFKGMHECEHIG